DDDIILHCKLLQFESLARFSGGGLERPVGDTAWQRGLGARHPRTAVRPFNDRGQRLAAERTRPGDKTGAPRRGKGLFSRARRLDADPTWPSPQNRSPSRNTPIVGSTT